MIGIDTGTCMYVLCTGMYYYIHVCITINTYIKISIHLKIKKDQYMYNNTSHLLLQYLQSLLLTSIWFHCACDPRNVNVAQTWKKGRAEAAVILTRDGVFSQDEVDFDEIVRNEPDCTMYKPRGEYVGVTGHD